MSDTSGFRWPWSSSAAVWGTDPNILHRTESKQTSVDAAYSVDTCYLEMLVFNAVCSYKDCGCIADDLLRDHPYLPYSSITARPSALERKNLITYGPDTRPGKSGKQQGVLRQSPYAQAILARSPLPKPQRKKRDKSE
jgi:hypothetical protein